MRPLRLDLAGFTVFREPTTVDFTDADFFALVGPTGSGKSTILDAICFALYGTVPRWGDRRAIANALAPSCTEARVRLVFESAGRRFVLTRVIRRDGKGNVATKGAAMEQLPAGFDLTRFDSGLSAEDLGDVVAGNPSEVDDAVQEIIGLPYEQFTKCVVLPQGDFAAFLHAKPAERQKILVNLLGLDVYGQIRERANAEAAAAEAQIKACDGLLAGLTDADDAALHAAEARVGVLRTLASDVDALMPELDRARRDALAARETLTALDAEIDKLARVRIPAGIASVADAATAARAAVTGAAEAVTAAEEREEKLRGELAAAGDEAALRRLLDAHAERARLGREAERLAGAVAGAQAEHDRAVTALEEARRQAAEAQAALDAAFEAYEAAQTADAAAALRPHLRVGDACPVCEQNVAKLPKIAGAGSAVDAAKAAGQKARKAKNDADERVKKCDSAVRDLDRTLTAARAQAEQLAGRLADLDGRLADAPEPAAIERDLAGIAAAARNLDEATAAVRAAREEHRAAVAAAGRAEEKVRAGWRDFDRVRDDLARLGPPPADRDDLAGAWTALADWTAAELLTRRGTREEVAASVADASGAADAVRDRIAALFTAAGSGTPGDDPARSAAVALERAQAELRRVEERRAQADRLREQRATHEREAQVAKALATHLRANNFERWLLEEALDSLVTGASQILRELSAGQYDLGHDKGEFFVVDHHDAGLRRAVRTLSGGETFQASLALALALSEQLAGLSTASASLESIVLDEGFGTLDAATLDTVTATLENLAARGERMVGVVTHVTALAERIPVRFEVRKDARTAHVERVGL
ncbi:SMC family ATPase [Planosporangium thailandense]|uniref:Nuclease SbcCD subunit C n=1 Tax=Planosporangium thailandense TaxID=765197 RepID=A0ABX0XT66_9ACTN|nr:SMC family ATPase [Planosporangium thailandense]NJC68434.1 SMC family ATPase [Planosporangium thailandense]